MDNFHDNKTKIYKIKDKKNRKTRKADQKQKRVYKSKKNAVSPAITPEGASSRPHSYTAGLLLKGRPPDREQLTQQPPAIT